MPSDAPPDTRTLLANNVTVPNHVVYRSFPSETVVLNLNTGRYHGLNATAGEMLESLERASCIRDAAAAISDRYGQPQTEVELDLCMLCNLLLDRGLIDVDEPPAV